MLLQPSSNAPFSRRKPRRGVENGGFRNIPHTFRAAATENPAKDAVSHSACVTLKSRAQAGSHPYTSGKGFRGAFAPGADGMKIETIETDDRGSELMALARLVAFALESAKALDVEVAEFCLDKALRSVLDQIDESSRTTLTASDIMLMNRMPLC